MEKKISQSVEQWKFQIEKEIRVEEKEHQFFPVCGL